MTPQLLQAIKLLQLSHQDLAAYVEAELERNPLLEPAQPDPEPPPVGADDGPAADPWLPTDLSQGRADLEGEMDTALDNVFPDENPVPVRSAAADADVRR